MTMTGTLREPAVAGRFYPEGPQGLATQVGALLRASPSFASPPSAVISPHAGYAYSGALTARALGAARDANPDTIVVLSPSHRHPFDGIAAPSQDAFRLPNGTVPMDTAARDALIAADLAHIEDAAHDQEHGVEVQLPFLHALFPATPVQALVLGRVSTQQIAQAVDLLAARRKTLFVLSSDLSHFLPLDDARATDLNTARRIETGEGPTLRPQEACGARAIAGYFASEHAQGCRPTRLAMANSESVTNDATRTVGYGAWAITPGKGDTMDAGQRAQLLRLARQVLTSRLSRGKPPHIDTASFPAPLQTHAACFVTLEQQGRLRGCIGSLAAHRPLVEDVATNVQKAAFEDPRFRPLQPEELDRTTLKIALLTPSRRMSFTSQEDLESQLTPHRDGLILRDGRHAGTFLPMVWEKLDTPHAFVEALKVKAGLPRNHWSDTLTIDRFHAESFSDA